MNWRLADYFYEKPIVRAYDAHIEHSLRDSGLDRSQGESISREGNHLSSLLGTSDRANAGNLSGKNLSVMDLAVNWQKDDKGNLVTMNRSGRLLARDDQGRTVDYSAHIENKRMASRDQMAFTSMLFCSPLMLFGMGATFAFMDQFHMSSKDRNYQNMKDKLDSSKPGGKTLGYDSKATALALLIANDRRFLSISNETSQVGHSAYIEQEIKDKRKKRLSDQLRSRPLAMSMVGERNVPSKRKLSKMKERLEEQLELMRGNACMEDVAKIESQVERLDRALKRLSALSM